MARKVILSLFTSFGLIFLLVAFLNIFANGETASFGVSSKSQIFGFRWFFSNLESFPKFNLYKVLDEITYFTTATDNMLNAIGNLLNITELLSSGDFITILKNIASLLYFGFVAISYSLLVLPYIIILLIGDALRVLTWLIEFILKPFQRSYF